MTWGERLLWFYLGFYACILVLNLGRTRDMLRESPKCEHSDKEAGDGK